MYIVFHTGYDGPMQYMMSPVNPDQVIPLQTNRISTFDGIYIYFFAIHSSIVYYIMFYGFFYLDLGNQIEVMSVEERLHDEVDEESVPITGAVPTSASAEEVRGAPIAPVSHLSERSFQHSDTNDVKIRIIFIRYQFERFDCNFFLLICSKILPKPKVWLKEL